MSFRTRLGVSVLLSVSGRTVKHTGSEDDVRR